MNVLVDRHQADLFYAMQLLFEDRLGFTVYTPVGHEWWDAGYWGFGRCFGDDRLARQYLVTPQRESLEDEAGDVYDQCHPERPIHTCTLDEFGHLGDWAFVVATVQENQSGFSRLARENGARYVVEVGNTGQHIEWALDPLVINSSEMPIAGRGVTVHQEFDSGTDYAFSDPSLNVEPGRVISSFVNLTQRIPESWDAMQRAKELLPNHTFKVFGHESPDGFITPARSVAEIMGASKWAWHWKPQGDGFGHVIHGWAAVGRPLIGPARYYAGKMAEPFWQDLVTCVDTSDRSLEEACALVDEIGSDRGRYEAMCLAMRETFDRLVDYDEEEARIRALLGL